MIKRLAVSATFALLMPAGSFAQSGTTYFRLSSNSHYDQYRSRLVEYLRSRHDRHATRFCLFGSKDETGAIATIIWPDGQEIIDWGGNREALIQSISILHLKTDVVPTEADIHGSTYLVTRQWVKDQEALCEQYGETVRISAADLKP
ncbi:hypothetical protein [Dyella mobilis]|uniref:Uncharacterized protein n=1 Tax=Dyella mobilis TaxID=1849582 RepID=A0ABS2KM66_9GAMM|nr:hypothetical protein [Dyella mobilis]MBM7131483.1 hypothetical protein [Dyella mobilis]GLQ96543.1 hypothetical protein GCM10007863_09610 [Dyella mobilis]